MKSNLSFVQCCNFEISESEYCRINVNKGAILKFIGMILVVFLHSGIALIPHAKSLHILSATCNNLFILATALQTFNKKNINYKSIIILVSECYLFNFIYEIFNFIINRNLDWMSLAIPFIYSKFWYIKVYIIFVFLIPLLVKMVNNNKSSRIFMVYYSIYNLIYVFVLWLYPIDYLFGIGTRLIHFINLYLLFRSFIFFKIYMVDTKRIVIIFITLFISYTLISWGGDIDIWIDMPFEVWISLFFSLLLIRINKYEFIWKYGKYSLYFYTFDLTIREYIWDIYIQKYLNVNVYLNFIIEFITCLFILFLILSIYLGIKNVFLILKNKYKEKPM